MISIEKPTEQARSEERETLETIVEEAEPLREVRKAELHSGDRGSTGLNAWSIAVKYTKICL